MTAEAAGTPRTDVHTEHCCAVCGCKYGRDDCPVFTRKLKASFTCEQGHAPDYIEPTNLYELVERYQSLANDYRENGDRLAAVATGYKEQCAEALARIDALTAELTAAQARLAERERDAGRYKIVKRMSVEQFEAAYQINVRMSKPFDQIIDELAPFHDAEIAKGKP